MTLLLLTLFSTLPYIIAYRNLSPYKFSIKDYIYMESIIVITCFLLNMLDSRLGSLSIYLVPIIFIYKKCSKILLSIFINIYVCVIIIFIDSCLGSIFIKFFNVDFNLKGIKYYIFCLILLIMIHFISKLISHFNKKNKLIMTKIAKSKYIILIYITLFITFALFYMNINWNTSRKPEYLTMTNGLFFIGYSLILLFICIVILLLIQKDESFKVRQIQFENLHDYTKNLEELYMDMRKFKHDYLNIISSIGGFIEDNNISGLNNYFNNIIYPLNEKMQLNDIKLGLLGNIKITELKGLLSSKLIKAQELKLDVSIDIAEPIAELNMDIIDCIRSLGILLDNAIEAAITTDEKHLSLGIVNTNSSIKIIIINSYSESIPSISKLFKEGYSTKGKNRGLGLSSLKDILNKNSTVLLDTSIENNKFIQVLTIHKIHGVE